MRPDKMEILIDRATACVLPLLICSINSPVKENLALVTQPYFI